MSVVARKAAFLDVLETFKPGVMIKGTFEVQKVVDSGGMSYVFRGLHRSLNKAVAIKVVKKKWINKTGAREQFIAEGQRLALINHHYVVKVYDVGIFENYTYLVMDYVRGTSLQTHLETYGGIETQTAISMMHKLCEALDAVHKAGLIHRDIKPSNIIINDSGDPILIDFGISVALDLGENSNGNGSALSEMIGTPGFVAPEIIKNPANITPSADIYSLGKTFYFMLTGQPLLNGSITRKLMEQEASTAPLNRNGCLKKLPEGMVKVIQKMTEPRTAMRYQSVAAVLNDLPRKKKQGFKFVGWLFFLVLGIGIALIFLSWKRQGQAHGWIPRARSIAVIPPSSAASDFTLFAYEVRKHLRYHYPYYEVVDADHVQRLIDELKLKKDRWISKTHSARIGEMTGAQFFMMFEKGNYRGEETIYPSLYDVETRLLVGSCSIDPNDFGNKSLRPKMIENTVNQLINDIASQLYYKSTISRVENDHVLMLHGRLYGAEVGMKLRVLDDSDKVIGVLEIVELGANSQRAKIIDSQGKISKGMRVKEIKIEENPDH